MKPHEWYQKTLDEVKGTLEYELEGVLIDVTEQMVLQLERKEMSRSDLARSLEVSSAYITKLLSGRPNMTVETLVKVFKALGCKIRFEVEPTPAIFTIPQVDLPKQQDFKLDIPLTQTADEYSSAAAA